MQHVSPAYLVALATQIGGLSAFLGGFAATFLATLLTLGHGGRLMTITIGFAVTSAVAFIVTVVAATMLTAVAHPDAPAVMSVVGTGPPRTIMTLCFVLGSVALLAGLGCSGWTRSAAIGWITTIAAATGGVLIIGMTVQVG